MEDQDAKDINQMMSAQEEVPVVAASKKSKLLWVVLACVIVGVGLGVVVYQQSVKPIPVTKISPKPVASAVTTVSSPVGSAHPAGVNAVMDKTMESNVITFPGTGKVRIYYDQLKPGTIVPVIPTLITLTSSSGTVSVTTPASVGSTPMATITTSMTVTAGQTVTVRAYTQNNTSQPAIGWVKPANNTCGKNGFGIFDVSAAISWAQSGTSPLVTQMCWSEYNPTPDTDTSAWAFNHFFMILAYEPTAASASPSVSPSVSPSISPSPSPSRSPSPSPSASTVAASTTTPTPSARVAMPDTSGGTPVTGVFEITVGTMSVGLILLLFGLFGLLAL